MFLKLGVAFTVKVSVTTRTFCVALRLLRILLLVHGYKISV